MVYPTVGNAAAAVVTGGAKRIGDPPTNLVFLLIRVVVYTQQLKSINRSIVVLHLVAICFKDSLSMQ